MSHGTFFCASLPGNTILVLEEMQSKKNLHRSESTSSRAITCPEACVRVLCFALASDLLCEAVSSALFEVSKPHKLCRRARMCEQFRMCYVPGSLHLARWEAPTWALTAAQRPQGRKSRQAHHGRCGRTLISATEL